MGSSLAKRILNLTGNIFWKDKIEDPVELARKFRSMIMNDEEYLVKKLHSNGLQDPSVLYRAMWESCGEEEPSGQRMDHYLRLVFSVWSHKSKVECTSFAKSLVSCFLQKATGYYD